MGNRSQLDTVCIEENAFYGEYDNYLKKKKREFFTFLNENLLRSLKSDKMIGNNEINVS